MNQNSGEKSATAQPCFTSTQGQYLAFIDAYSRVHGYPPAEAELQRHFQVTPPSVHQMILTLERLGFIRRTPRTARSIEVLVAPEYLPVLQREPVKSSVQRY
jgi:SOS-response transcriptional repressor LexA